MLPALVALRTALVTVKPWLYQLPDPALRRQALESTDGLILLVDIALGRVNPVRRDGGDGDAVRPIDPITREDR